MAERMEAYEIKNQSGTYWWIPLVRFAKGLMK